MIMQRRRSFEQVQAQTRVDPDRLSAVDAAWRAANYLGIAQLYLQDNALLRRPLKPGDIKPRLAGRWGDQPALNMVYVHLNRLIQDTDAGVQLSWRTSSSRARSASTTRSSTGTRPASTN
jgi:phosphoketolase